MALWGDGMTKEERAAKAREDAARKERLETLTATAKRGLAAYAETGAALESIKAEELWRLVSPTWDSWCASTLKMSERRVGQIIEASKLAAHLAAKGLEPPATERAARSLAGLQPEVQAEVWQEATEAAGGQPTADAVAAVAAARKPRKKGKKKSMMKPVSIRVPGATIRVVPRRNGFTSVEAALEYALAEVRKQSTSDKQAA